MSALGFRKPYVASPHRARQLDAVRCSPRRTCGVCSCRLPSYFASLSAPLLRASTCSVQSTGYSQLAARGALDVQRAAGGYLITLSLCLASAPLVGRCVDLALAVSSPWLLLTLPCSQLGSWCHRRAASSRWLLTYFGSRSPVSWARGAIVHRLAVCSRWLLTDFASQSAGLVAPSTCGVQSVAS